jgi:class 3 adenylate cyclase
MEWKKAYCIYMFADLRNFSGWSNRNLLEIEKLIEPVYSSVQQNFNKNSDVFIKFLGDGFLFVKEIELESPEFLMVAIIDLLQSIHSFETYFQDFKYSASTLHDLYSLNFAYGVSYGFSMKYKSNNSNDYVGDKLNLAARLCSKAKKKEILFEEGFDNVLPLIHKEIMKYCRIQSGREITFKGFGKRDVWSYILND